MGNPYWIKKGGITVMAVMVYGVFFRLTSLMNV